MAVPKRAGVESAGWLRRVARRDRERDAELRYLADSTEAGGLVVLWVRASASRVQEQELRIQPGVVDDLPSLLSSLAVEIAWPGSPAAPGSEHIVAVWARVWQVREAADLRLTLWWEHDGAFHAMAELHPRTGAGRTVAASDELIALLDRVAVTPESSRSPHGLLLAGNRAMEADDYAAARAAYEGALLDLPRHSEVHRNLALARARLGDWEGAALVMDTAFALAPDDHQLRAEYLALETDAGIDAVRRGELETAAQHFLRLLARWPDEPTALANLGNLRRRENRLPEARAIYRRFLAHHPDHPGAETIRQALREIET